MADFNDDGHPDIFVADNNEMELLLNDGKAAFKRSALPLTNFNQCMCNPGKAAVAADFDGDGDVDIYVGVDMGKIRRCRLTSG